ncbi:MAG: phage tail protein [Lentimicrobiaceae bacterium]|nr:phage tail protein [Lentimicrobiaceae bacterium]
MANPEAYYPPLGFHFRVKFGISGNTADARFQSVSGLSVEYDYENFREGGENRFEHKLPVRTKYGDMVLKRGMLNDSEVVNWCNRAFRDRQFEPSDLTVILLNEKGEPLKTWKVAHAIPKKWMVSDLNSMENTIVIETLELTYQYFTMQDGAG